MILRRRLRLVFAAPLLGAAAWCRRCVDSALRESTPLGLGAAWILRCRLVAAPPGLAAAFSRLDASSLLLCPSLTLCFCFCLEFGSLMSSASVSTFDVKSPTDVQTSQTVALIAPNS